MYATYPMMDETIRRLDDHAVRRAATGLERRERASRWSAAAQARAKGWIERLRGRGHEPAPGCYQQ